MGQGHFPAVHIWATLRLIYILGGMWDSPAVSPGMQGTGTTGRRDPHPSSRSLPAAPQLCEGRSAPIPLLMSGDENNSSHQICIGSLCAAAMVPQLPGEGWSPRGVEPGAQRWQSTEPAPRRAGQLATPGEWLWCPSWVAPPLGSQVLRWLGREGPLCAMVVFK